MVLLLALACASPAARTSADAHVSERGPDTAGPDDTADTAGPDGSADSAYSDGLLGARIDPPLAPPVFAVLDMGGAPRTEADLLGHPTVLWFFREAEGST
jgi:hypothetical protein